MKPELHAALTRLYAWKAVRPGSGLLKVPTASLEERGLVKRIPTLIGVGLTLSAQGRSELGLLSRLTASEGAVSTALYLQDAREDLARAGFKQLRPGRGAFRVVTGPNGKACPLLGRVIMGGYSRKRIRACLDTLEPDLLAGGVKLVVVHPRAPDLLMTHPRLQVVYSPPRWPG